MYKLWNMLAEMQSDAYEWVELSHSMNNDSPVWSGIPAGSVEVSKTVFDWGNPMLECLIQTFKFPGQYGTHIDFPGHFVKDMPLSEAFGAQQMLFPLCVIDITAKVAEDVHYAVTVEDIKAAAQKLAHAFAGVGGDGDNRHGQRILHCFDVNTAAAAGELVHHVEGDDHRDIQLDELQRKIQAAFNISCVNNVDNSVRLIV